MRAVMGLPPKSARCMGLSTTFLPASTSCASDSLQGGGGEGVRVWGEVRV